MSDKIERKRKELEVLEAEAEFREKKAAGTLTNEDKLALRALRQEFRENHRQAKPGASPAAISNKAKAEDV